jgi:hypothetical protein
MNEQRAEVGIEINGELLKLRFTTNAIAEIEATLDDKEASIWDVFTQTSVTVRRQLLWAALRGGDAKRFAALTVADVGDMMDAADPLEIRIALEKSQLLFMGAKDADLKNVEATMRAEQAMKLSLMSIVDESTGTPGTVSASSASA